MTAAFVAFGVYVAAVLLVGVLAGRSARAGGDASEEYFLAGRGLASVVLFMALFGTNCTAFVLVGVPGQAWRDGIAVFGVNAPIIALGIPLTFWAVGSPARRLARVHGALTPAELYSRQLGSRAVGLVLFAFFTLYTIPYMVTAVRGAALTLEGATAGALPQWLGGALVLAVALVYTSLGGMRATAWTNVVQGALFLAFMVVACVLFVRGVGGEGGLGGALERLRAQDEDLLVRPDGGLYAPRAWASWSLAIALTVVSFPHMLARLMAAEGDRSLRAICRAYPVALVVLWIPAVLTGVLARAAFPDLPVADRAFPAMVETFLPPWLALFGFLAVLAAVMSTLDAQLLTLGSMLTRDVLPGARGGPPERDVRLGRLFALALAVGTYVLWLVAGGSIFGVASVAFSGYVTLFPTLLLGVRWRRFTARAAVASMVAGNLVYWAALVEAGGAGGWREGALRPAWAGFLPVAWGFAAAVAAALLASLGAGGRVSGDSRRRSGAPAVGPTP